MACSFVSVRGYAGCAVLALRGDLDISDAEGLSAWLAGALSCGPWVIVDLAELACIDSSSFRVLAGAREQARAAGGDVLLAGPGAVVSRLLALTGWAEVFSVFPCIGLAGFSAGLAAFSGRLAASSAATSRTGRSPGQPDYRGAA